MPKLVERTETVMYRYGRMVTQVTGREWLWLSPPEPHMDRVTAQCEQATHAMHVTYRMFRETTITTLEEIDGDE